MKLFFSIVIALLFIGCSTPPKAPLPTYDKVQDVKIKHKSIINRGKRGEFLKYSEWTKLKIVHKDAKLKANSCINVIELHNKSLK